LGVILENDSSAGSLALETIVREGTCKSYSLCTSKVKRLKKILLCGTKLYTCLT
jgi:hypothetical protein